MTYIKWPCIFLHPLVKDANKKLYENYPKVPIGAFQRAFRTEHCSQLDFYGTGSCPYKARDCVLAYYQAADRTMYEAKSSPVGLFRKIARSSGAQRADEKPTMRTDGNQDAAGSVGRDPDEGRKLRTGSPRSIGDLFGENDG